MPASGRVELVDLVAGGAVLVRARQGVHSQSHVRGGRCGVGHRVSSKFVLLS